MVRHAAGGRRLATGPPRYSATGGEISANSTWEVFERLPDFGELVADSRSALVYGRPYETADGSTVITVAKVRTNEQAVRARPVGVFVIRDGKATWESVARVALMGELIGLVAATLATLAVVRRPPWPDLTRPK